MGFFACSLMSLFIILSLSPEVKAAKKVIVIDQRQQVGATYESGRLVMKFSILSGDDETPTGNGTYRV